MIPASRYLRTSFKTMRSLTSRATRDIVLNPVKEPVQIKVHNPPIAVLNSPPRNPDRQMGRPARTETERRTRKLRVENRHEHVRHGLLHQAVQHPRHPNIRSPPPGFGMIT
jgi:site-specific DNA recombinase